MSQYALSLIVRKDSAIELRGEGEGVGDLPRGRVDLPHLRKATIEVFDSWLKQGKLETRQELQVLGEHLFRTLFDKGGEDGEPPDDALRAMLERARSAGERLVVRLAFEGTDELAAMPWEYVFSPATETRPGYFLSINTDLILSRYLEIEQPDQRPAEHGRLRVLVVVAEPSDIPIKRLDVERFLTEITPATRDLMEIKRADDATLMQFLESAGAFRPHVVHLIGHGRYKDNEAQIALLHDNGTANWVDQSRFAAAFGATDWRPPVIFLHLSESSVQKGDFNLSFERLGPELVRAGIPAVIAMRFPIAVEAATQFSKSFYSDLADGKPVDAAVRTGRYWINMYSKPGWVFGTPVLFMHGSGQVIASPTVHDVPTARDQRQPAKPLEQTGGNGGAPGAQMPAIDRSGFADRTTDPADAALVGDTVAAVPAPSQTRALILIRAGRERLEALDVDGATRLRIAQDLVRLQQQLAQRTEFEQGQYLSELPETREPHLQEVLNAVVLASLGADS